VIHPFDITAGVMQGDTLSPFLFVVIVDYIMKLTFPDPNAGFRWKREGSRRPAGHIADLDYAKKKSPIYSAFTALYLQPTPLLPMILFCGF